MYVTVVTASKSKEISKGLLYKSDTATVGSLVRVPLRKQIVEGVITDIQKKSTSEFSVRDITSVTQAQLTPAQIATAKWMSGYYCTSLRQTLSLWLPGNRWDNFLPKEKVRYVLQKDDSQLRGSKQKLVVNTLIDHGGSLTKSALQKSTGATLQTIQSLVKSNVLTEERESEFEPTDKNILEQPKLTSEQQAAYTVIRDSAKPSLLFGVTGSGKTEVYAQLIADCIQSSKTALFLVPEILLTQECIERYEQLVPKEHIAILHSKLTIAKRLKLWRKIQQGHISLVIGSRSALFSPIQNLGLIVIDEEHEWTYKNEKMPRYNARDVSEVLAKESAAKLVVGSATPSLETWKKAKDGIYTTASLAKRYNDAPLPDVRIIDLADVEFGSKYPLSPTLVQALHDQLDAKEQSVLFLNRRGHSTSFLCLDCRRRLVSSETKLPLVVHKQGDNHVLLDHTTGVVSPLPDCCPHCQSTNMRLVGAGTQRIEEILKAEFPNATIERVDTDVLQSIDEMQNLLSLLHSGEIDILLGTQSVVKGLDVDNVTLSAVVLADVGLSLPHFRAGERTFQLLTQLVGRSGRKKPGKVIIQTFRPDCLEVQHSAKHQVSEYLDNELSLRTFSSYPPAMQMAKLVCRGHQAQAQAIVLKNNIADNGCEFVHAMPTLFSGGKDWNVLLRSEDIHKMLQNIDLEGVSIDIDPTDTF